MKNAILGELSFDTGWKTNCKITMFNKECNIVVKLKAYFDKDGITTEQENSISVFFKNKRNFVNKIEELSQKYDPENYKTRFCPQTLLFQRDGEFALLLDDAIDRDDGIAICLYPRESVISQNGYL